jgi:hypothetical protein
MEAYMSGINSAIQSHEDEAAKARAARTASISPMPKTACSGASCAHAGRGDTPFLLADSGLHLRR